MLKKCYDGYMDKRTGFTLIELSIVLVIIGLIVGGVLAGRELVRQAELRNAVAMIGDVRVAVNIFKTKYNCLPGDCANVVNFNLGTPGGVGDNGNGNGLVDSSAEYLNFWYHLALSGGLKGNYTGSNGQTTFTPGVDFPAFNMKGGVGLHIQQPGPTIGANQFVGSNLLWITGQYTIRPASTFIPSDNFYIDSKIDDGFPGRGNVIVSVNLESMVGGFVHIAENAATGTNASYSTGGAVGGNNCAVSSTPAVWNVSNSNATNGTRCMLEIRVPF